MGSYQTGSGSGLVTDDDLPLPADLARAMQVFAKLNPEHPASVAMRTLPDSVASLALSHGVPHRLLQQHAAAKVGPSVAQTLSPSQAVRVIGLPKVAEVMKTPVKRVLQATGAGRVTAMAAGLLPAVGTVVPKSNLAKRIADRAAAAKRTAGVRAAFSHMNPPTTVAKPKGKTCCVPCGTGQLGDLGGLAQLGASAAIVVTPGGVAGEDDDKPAPKLSGDGFPASPGFRPGNWKNGRPSSDDPQYMVAPGDTFSGLARTYLGGPNRWRDIWSPNKAQVPNPDKLSANIWITMPPEAVEAAKSMMHDDKTPKVPASPGAPATVPGKKDPATTKPSVIEKAQDQGWLVPAAIGGGVLLLGGIAIAATR